jgi:hypothetical protein
MKYRNVILRKFIGSWVMKRSVNFLTITLVTFILVGGICFAGSEMKPAIKTNPEFERMKSLVGNWEGKSTDGSSANVSYTLVSDNSALMEKIAMGSESEMLTVYHPDGDRLMMTHYCSLHNQPRMRSQTSRPDQNKIAFDFVDVTNLSAPGAGHMSRLIVTFEDKDHITQEWTYREKDRESTVVVRFERKK